MSHPDLVQRHFAAQDFRFRDGYHLVAIEEETERLAVTAEAISEEWTVSRLVDAGNYDRTVIQLVLSASNVQFLETGEGSHPPASAAVERSTIRREMVPGRLSAMGLDDRAMTLVLTGGMPVRFDRSTSVLEQFRGDVADWNVAPAGRRYGVDFTDSLLRTLAVRQGIEVPRELRPARVGFGRRVTDPRTEAVKARLRETHLRTHFLQERFAQNAGRVSILAAFPSIHPIVDAV